MTLKSLLQTMTDRAHLAEFPSPAFDCAQASSYDRKSESPEDRDNWYANWDRSQFVRIDETDGKKEYVMMDAQGPGAIVRIWGTWHGPKGQPFSNGTIRFYLDGSDTPAIEGPITEVIDGGRLAVGPLSQSVSPSTEYRRRGHNLYVPIPYAKSCKVTYQTDVPVDVGGRKGEALYYQINYRTYEPGTKVETFSMDRLAQASEQLKAAQVKLINGSRDSGDDWKRNNWKGKIAAGESQTIAEVDSMGALRRLRVRLARNTPEQALRSMVLKLEFDGNQTVWAPVGDFFGVGYKPMPYQSWYTAYSGDGVMSCEWVMPFEKGCKVSLQNVGSEEVEVLFAEAVSSDWEWGERSMHFHSTWRQYTGVKTEGSKNMNDTKQARDVNYVQVEGQGVYVGDTLTLFNGAPRWWGEGDEKIYVDDESFPSHFGTGTEDYYGYAWCRPENFAAPFHAQPNGEGNLRGGFAVNSRYRALDTIPFSKAFKFDMEFWHWGKSTNNYAPTTFFYAKPGATNNVTPDAKSAGLKVVMSKDDLPE